jgi:diguanylate cyclase (GGDEF)-like protein
MSDAAGPFTSFSHAAEGALTLLSQRMPLDLWLVARREGAGLVVLEAVDRGYGIATEDAFLWSETLEALAAEPGARFDPDAAGQAFEGGPIGRSLSVGSFVGAPIEREDGAVFGVLCGMHPTALAGDSTVPEELPLVELLARMLAAVLTHELAANEESRRAERAELQALTDPLTGIVNRRAWEQLLEHEEFRCARYGHPAAIFSVDIDNLKQTNDAKGHAAGDELLRTTARALGLAIRHRDTIARVGGDEFAILAIECDGRAATTLAERLRIALELDSIEASLGFAARRPGGGLERSWLEADDAMYRDKRLRKAPASRSLALRTKARGRRPAA